MTLPKPDAAYIRPEDRLWESACALKSMGRPKDVRDFYIAQAKAAIAMMEVDPSVVSHNIAPRRRICEDAPSTPRAECQGSHD